MATKNVKRHEKIDREGTRTLNLLIRSQTPYPLGHAVIHGSVSFRTYLIPIVNVCWFVDILEGNLTNAMEKKYDEACAEVLQEIQHTMITNGENKATAFLKYQSQPLLCEKVCRQETSKLATEH